MKSTHRFQVKASVETVYKSVISADRWLSFVPGYQGLESADPNWPNEGSSLVVRFGFGPWMPRFKVTVVEHERGHRFITHEEAFGGLYTDDVAFIFEGKNETNRITAIRELGSKSLLIRILLLLLFPLRWVTAYYFIRRVKAMVEI